MSDAPDSLYDASDEAIAAKLLMFKPRGVSVEDPIERAMFGLIASVEDMHGVLLLARSPEALAALRAVAEDAIKSLIILSSTCLTLEEYPERLS